ncbi:MAG: hypothetical protein EA353_11840 [Puniceicoccaceae bacterium]|nr:MAG: hypothetical protein EA353_11840 [Puniceicoccaceae bacterium]
MNNIRRRHSLEIRATTCIRLVFVAIHRTDNEIDTANAPKKPVSDKMIEHFVKYHTQNNTSALDFNLLHICAKMQILTELYNFSALRKWLF